MCPDRNNVLFSVQNREITGRSLSVQQFRGIRPVRLQDLKKFANFKNADGHFELREINAAQCLMFHRLSHDSTKLVAIQNQSWTLQRSRTNGQIIVYEILPTYIIKTTCFPICPVSLYGILFCGFNQDSSILCAITAIPACTETENNGFLSRDPIKIQFGLFKHNLCITMKLATWFESELNRKQLARSMIKSRDNLFILNYGRSEISIFGFHDMPPWRMMHAKVFKLKCKGPREEGQSNVASSLQFKNRELEVIGLSVSDGQNRNNWTLFEVNPLKVKHHPGNLYFSITHIEFERTFKYAIGGLIKKMDDKAEFVCLIKCQATVLEISDNQIMQVYLAGIAQVLIPKASPFLVAAFLVSWNLDTNQMNCQLIGAKQNPTQYVKNLNDCTKGMTKVDFYDCMTCFDFLGGDSINSMISHFGGISLYL